MSGLEVLVAYGVACDVIQLLSFAQAGVAIAKRINDTKSVERNLQICLHYMNGGLNRLEKSLKSVKPLERTEPELMGIAKQSYATTHELRALLLDNSNPISRKTAEGMAEKIHGLQEDFRYRLLERSWSCETCPPDEPQPAPPSNPENTDDRVNLSRSLEYSGLYGWLNVGEPHRKTFSSVFDTSGLENDPVTTKRTSPDQVAWMRQGASNVKMSWDDFTAWLRDSKQQPYLISGGAQSGKSVMIKFLANHPLTQCFLEEFHGTTLIITAYAARKVVTKRLPEQILLSLVHELVQKVPGISAQILETFPATQEKTGFEDWSFNELCDIVRYVLSTRKEHICVFIDGMDERASESDQEGILHLWDEISSLPEVHLCITFRSHSVFLGHFPQAPHLEMQCMLRYDIDQYMRSISGDHDSEGYQTTNTDLDEIVAQVNKTTLSTENTTTDSDEPAEVNMCRLLRPNFRKALFSQMLHCSMEDRRSASTDANYLSFFIPLIMAILGINLGYWQGHIANFVLVLDSELTLRVLTQDTSSWADTMRIKEQQMTELLLVQCAGLVGISQNGFVKNSTVVNATYQNIDDQDRTRLEENFSDVHTEDFTINAMLACLACAKIDMVAPKLLGQRDSSTYKFPDSPDTLISGSTSVLDRAHTIMLRGKPLSSQDADTFLSFSQQLYEIHHWPFEIIRCRKPDFLGAALWSGFFQWARAKFDKLLSEAPHGMMVSETYKFYILDLAANHICGEMMESYKSKQCVLDFESLIGHLSFRPAEHSYVTFSQQLGRRTNDPYQRFFLASSPIVLVLSRIIYITEQDRYDYSDNPSLHPTASRMARPGFTMLNSILNAGYTGADTTLLVLRTSGVKGSCDPLKQTYYYCSSKSNEDLEEGTLFIKANTSAILEIFFEIVVATGSPNPEVHSSLRAALEKARMFTKPFMKVVAFTPRSTPSPRKALVRCLYHSSRATKARFRQARDNFTRTIELLVPIDSDEISLDTSDFILHDPEEEELGFRGVSLAHIRPKLQDISSRARSTTLYTLEQEWVKEGLLVPAEKVDENFPPKPFTPVT
ncbi:unnamed protein product [Periconia digitata]|uniref:Nephrocystin 3-like N-terminal domain-containing protein n=1 Tax=Periconia digitata TaxID=1303443 RepID=A0A9W4XMZ4_9PLEO|nr:unnamed protein product [Periconia digitata]